MLSDAACKNAKPKEKIYAVTDGEGLYLEIHPNGSKYLCRHVIVKIVVHCGSNQKE
jgi:hypothetical protein